MKGLTDLTWPIRTERLQLRPAVEDDLRAMWLIRCQEGVTRWMTDDAQEWERFVEHSHEVKRLDATLILERDAVVVGEAMLRIEDAWSQTEVKEQARGVQAELGWSLDQAYVGNGYATEAARELIRISFADLGLRRVTALCFADNEASWRLMERVGMRREAHHVKESLHRSGEWLDGLHYALLAEEWSGPAGPAPVA